MRFSNLKGGMGFILMLPRFLVQDMEENSTIKAWDRKGKMK